jgi:hypothetical protein
MAFELCPVGAAGTFTGVDVFVEHVGVERFGLTETGFTLGGDTESFGVTVGLDLPGG